MDTGILQKTLYIVSKFIEQKALISANEKVLIAISGGPDSVFLAYVLHSLGYKIGLAHINYQLRGQTSEDEEKLIESYGKKWNIPVYISKIEPKKAAKNQGTSMQVAARNFRYQFFEEVMDQYGYQKCATAHHLDDQAESILMSLSKGNNSALIKPIPVIRERYIRPLLQLSKKEIIFNLQSIGLPYSHDITNDGTDYLRNKFRNQVLPILSDINPSISQHLSEKNNWYQLQFHFIQNLLNQKETQYISQKEDVKRLYFAEFENQFGKKFLPILIQWALEKWGIHGKESWEIIKLIDSESGKMIVTDQGKISRSREGLVLEKLTDENEFLSLDELPNPFTTKLGEQTLHFSILENEKPAFGIKNILYLDIDQLQFPLQIRRWKIGDKMKPLGMKFNKKLSDIFIDLKLDSAHKAKVIVFQDENHIFALNPFRISEDVKLSKKTKNILKIVIEE